MDLSPEVLTKLERLMAARIQILPTLGAGRHFGFERDGYAALVERRENGFGTIGSAGILSEKGFAVLVHREGKAYFIAKNFEQRATDEQVAELRAFQGDLERALGAVGPVGN